MPCECTVNAIKEVMAAGTCCAELKAACQAYLDAIGTPNQNAAADALVAELNDDVTSIDGLLAFLGTEKAVGYLGAEAVAGMKTAAEKAKAEGVTVCICPACTLGAKVLANKDKLYA